MVEEHDPLVGLPQPLFVGGGTNTWEEGRREGSTWLSYAPDEERGTYYTKGLITEPSQFYSHSQSQYMEPEEHQEREAYH